ncbi:MAG TPA: glucosyltransferase domain-containing protein [Candidatus Limiplasma pullicola]|nr:glucosyltransferase domain-containing protein [Candidatus Limiplasma pullicola]
MKRYLRVVENRLNTNLSRRQLLKFCLIAGMLLGVLAHGFMFANKIPNHDDMRFGMDLTGAGLESGRFVLYFFWKLLSTMSVPWLNGLLGVLFLSLAAWLACDAFDLRRVWQAGALLCVLIVYPLNATIFCFMYEAHVFSLGILLAMAAPWLTRRARLGFLWAALCVMLCTGIYQGFLMLAIGMLILLVIQRTAYGQAQSGWAAWRFAIGCAAAAIAGVLLYLGAMALLTRVGAVVLSDYQSINQMGKLDVSTLPSKLAMAWNTVWDHYLWDVPDYTTRLMRLAQITLVALGYGWLAVRVVLSAVRRRWGHAALLAVCGVLLVLSAAGVFMMGENINAHQLTLYSLIVILLLPVTCLPHEAERPGRQMLRRLCAAALAAACLGYGFQCTILDNQAYYQLYSSFTRISHAMNRLALSIEEEPQYRPGLRIATVGFMSWEDPPVYFDYELASRFRPFGGVLNEIDFAAPSCAPYLLTRVIGLPLTPVDNWQPTEAEQAIVDAMPCYPAEGCVTIIGDLCVVRFS